MFTSREEIKSRTGYDVEQQTLLLAQLVIETWTGKDEAEVDDASDKAVLGRATMFQAIYMQQNEGISLEEIAAVTKTIAESSVRLDTDRFAPFLSPWAFEACKKLSWVGTRTIRTGPVFDRAPRLETWERT